MVTMLRILALTIAVSLPGTTAAGETSILVASTTSTENSGLFQHLLPRFTARTGIAVRVVAVGTGQAIALASNGDADVLFVHHRASEERFVADGYGVARHPVMYKDYVIVGPAADPAGIAGHTDAAASLAAIAAAGAAFASRGDDSGTHKAELQLWQAAGIEPATARGTWYRETGSGMGATLNTASGLDAYALSDRATWISFANKGELGILVEGDPRLTNQYSVILVDPQRHPHVKADAGQAFIDWLTGSEGQRAIDAFAIDGQQIFFANARREES